ncbi:MAG: right-handed parallel beta-helix repeat-containing protein [Bryobacteraceae bacterium]|nr:right-handed parallel beta-helix repeat-containing protein [Bryobacteraceae bacterium]
MKRLLHLLASFAAASTFAAAAGYYVSPKGDDRAAGNKSGPWRTIARVNLARFQPGDRILFEGGQTFAGRIEIGPSSSGAANAPVVLSSFGSGRAIIDGGNREALVVDGAAHITIRSLEFKGAGRKTGSETSGVVLRNSSNLAVADIEVRGFRSSGLALDGVTNVRISGVRAHLNGFAGISSGGKLSKNLTIINCLAENNPGDPTVRNNHSGNGIVAGSAQDVLIERCEARYNGWDMPWTGNGPVGIWAYRADRVTIRHCLSHHNRSTASDGGGFDLDGGVTNSILEYNYSHSNFGAGYLICQYKDAGPFENNVVRYNISQDDGLFDHNAAIFVWVGGAQMKSALVHNNTVLNAKGSAVIIRGAKEYASQMPALAFYNNIFVTQGPQIIGSRHGKFSGNLYWSLGERGFRVDDFKSLEQWSAATGQEMAAAKLAGLYADPLLRKDGNGLLTDPKLLNELREYQLHPGSPAAGAGLDLRALFSIDPGGRDYYGNPLPAAGPLSIGAHEAAARR